MDMKSPMVAPLTSFFLALQFLTRLPVPGDLDYSAKAMRQSPGWYPAVGLVVGSAAAAVFWLAALVLPQAVAVLLAVGAGLMLTGALHEDGFADLCDGLGGGRGDRVRTLEIMRDSRIGAFGAMGLFMVLALRLSCLALLPVGLAGVALILGAVLSRGSMVRAMAGAEYARSQGAGSAVAGDMAPEVLQRALLTAIGAAALALPFVGLWPLICGLAGLALAHLALRRLYEPRLGGYTGDCLGAVQVTSEIGFLLGLLAGA